MKKNILLAVLLLSACQGTNITSQSKEAELATSKQTQAVVSKTVASEMMISTKGIGKAKLGMTLQQLQEVSGENVDFEIIPSFLTGVDAIAVSEKGMMQYYILYELDDDLDSNADISYENRVIKTLMTNNNQYQTELGVAVGTSIQEAEEVYGNAVLAYNAEGESEEYITFGNKNPDNIKFRASRFKLISDGSGFSGIYPEYPGVSYTTDKYRDDAVIAEIQVSCNSDECIY